MNGIFHIIDTLEKLRIIEDRLSQSRLLYYFYKPLKLQWVEESCEYEGCTSAIIAEKLYLLAYPNRDATNYEITDLFYLNYFLTAIFLHVIFSLYLLIFNFLFQLTKVYSNKT